MTVAEQKRAGSEPVRLEVLAYAPTEFFHCQHCEVVWNQIGLGQRWRADQRSAGQLPPDLQAEYAAISDWIVDASERYGRCLQVTVVDAASIEGFWKALRHRIRRFPSFVIDGKRRITSFDRERLDAELAARFSPSMPQASAPATRPAGGERR